MSQTPERRAAPRYACLGQVAIDKDPGAPPLRCRLVDLSAGGCLIAPLAPSRFATDSEIEFIIETGVTVFRARGNVRSTDPDTGAIGVQFLAMTMRGRIALNELMAELHEAKVPDLNRRPRYTFWNAA